MSANNLVQNFMSLNLTLYVVSSVSLKQEAGRVTRAVAASREQDKAT